MADPNAERQLRRYLEGFGDPLPDEEWAALYAALSFRRLQKDQTFQRPDELPRELGFVVEGLFRIYYQDRDGNEFIRAFAFEGQPIADYASYLEQAPSNVCIQAIEDSTIFSMTFVDYFSLFNRHPIWDRIGRKIVERFYLVRERREAEMLMLSAAERYQRFRLNFPGLSGRLSNVHIASYLGMAPETLSRLKSGRS